MHDIRETHDMIHIKHWPVTDKLKQHTYTCASHTDKRIIQRKRMCVRAFASLPEICKPRASCRPPKRKTQHMPVLRANKRTLGVRLISRLGRGPPPPKVRNGISCIFRFLRGSGELWPETRTIHNATSANGVWVAETNLGYFQLI